MESENQINPNPKSQSNPATLGGVRYDSTGHRLCNAKKSAYGEPNTCNRWAMTSIGSDKCNWHGGKTPRGVASPHYQGKGHSKYIQALPARMRADYQRTENDPNLISNEKEIALVETRLIDMIKGAELGESTSNWESVREAWDEFNQAMTDADGEGAKVIASRINDLITKGGNEIAFWDSMLKVLEQRRKLVDSEVKRLLQGQEVLTANNARLIYDALLLAVVEETDTAITAILKLSKGTEAEGSLSFIKEMRSKIQNRFIRIVQGGSEFRKLAAG